MFLMRRVLYVAIWLEFAVVIVGVVVGAVDIKLTCYWCCVCACVDIVV